MYALLTLNAASAPPIPAVLISPRSKENAIIAEGQGVLRLLALADPLLAAVRTSPV